MLQSYKIDGANIHLESVANTVSKTINFEPVIQDIESVIQGRQRVVSRYLCA